MLLIYTTMAFRTAPGSVVVVSTTAAAGGNVSQRSLPGGLRTMISRIGVGLRQILGEDFPVEELRRLVDN